MGFVEFLIIVFAICLFTALFTWAIRTFVPNTPTWIVQLVWGVAGLVIIVLLVQATGLMKYDPKIPSR